MSAREWEKERKLHVWNNTAPKDTSYRDHIRGGHASSFSSVVRKLGSAALCHHSLEWVFDYIKFPYTVSDGMKRDTALIADTLLKVTNLQPLDALL